LHTLDVSGRTGRIEAICIEVNEFAGGDLTGRAEPLVRPQLNQTLKGKKLGHCPGVVCPDDPRVASVVNASEQIIAQEWGTFGPYTHQEGEMWRVRHIGGRSKE
jgi:hypothetical protein